MSGKSSPKMFSSDFSDDKWPNENWPELEFRSPEDEAWYGIEVWTMCNSLVVSFNGFTSEYDEIYPHDDFKNLEKLKEFKERFRATSVQMQDLQCPTVGKGTRVCASAPSVAGEVKFFDAVVVGVERVKHESDEEGNEVCCCIFKLRWKQGPCVGRVTCAAVGDICLESEDNRLNPKLVSFLKQVERQLSVDASSSHRGEATEWQKTLNKVRSALQHYNKNQD